MPTKTRPAVSDNRPPKAVLAVVNPLMRWLLRSPLHRVASGKLMLVEVTGRKSGRTHVVPVGRHEKDGEFLLSASGAWRHNVRGGAAVTLTIEGHERAGHAELEEDPERVAETYAWFLDRYGRRGASLVGLKVHVDRPITSADLATAVAGRGIVKVRLSPQLS